MGSREESAPGLSERDRQDLHNDQVAQRTAQAIRAFLIDEFGAGFSDYRARTRGRVSKARVVLTEIDGIDKIEFHLKTVPETDGDFNGSAVSP